MFDELLKLAKAFDPKQAQNLLADFQQLVQTVNKQSADIAEMKAQLARIEKQWLMNSKPL